ncbi:hypothetical protein Tco_0541713, partial [Tanacetum coccineum]
MGQSNSYMPFRSHILVSKITNPHIRNEDKEIVVANKMRASSVSASFRRDVRDGAERQQWDVLSSIMNSVVLSSSKD